MNSSVLVEYQIMAVTIFMHFCKVYCISYYAIGENDFNENDNVPIPQWIVIINQFD